MTWRLYLEISGLLTLVWCCFRSATLSGRSPLQALRLAQCLVVFATVLPFAASMLPQIDFVRAPAQVFSSAKSSMISFSVPRAQAHSLSTPTHSLFFLQFGVAILAALALGRFCFDFVRLYQLVTRSNGIHSLGRVRVVASSFTRIPFSARVWGKAYIVIPLPAWNATGDLPLIIRHEIQHHRQRDPQWALVAAAIEAIFFWNPFIKHLFRYVSELQELACDRSLIDRGKTNALAYSRCLIRAAESALKPCPLLVGTTGMAAGVSGAQLKRRIQMILEPSKTDITPWRVGFFAVGTACLLAGTALASRTLVREGGLAMPEARRIAEISSRASQVPIVMNESILKELNYFVGDPKGREFVRLALKRMPAYEALVGSKIADYNLPNELSAIPLVESGYKNQAPGTYVGAGLWMFIISTARRYDLVIDGDRDERTHEAKETDAGMRYLTDLHAQFHDWWLAIAAYNQGERHVQQQIDESGVSDAWRLVELGRLNRYTSQVMAAILILKNPSLQP